MVFPKVVDVFFVGIDGDFEFFGHFPEKGAFDGFPIVDSPLGQLPEIEFLLVTEKNLFVFEKAANDGRAETLATEGVKVGGSGTVVSGFAWGSGFRGGGREGPCWG